jgi:hypothetical protein
MFSKTLPVVVMYKGPPHVTSASHSPFNSLASNVLQSSLCLLSNEKLCCLLSYKHTNVSQENSAAIFRAEEYFTMDTFHTETFVSTKLHGVIRR